MTAPRGRDPWPSRRWGADLSAVADGSTPVLHSDNIDQSDRLVDPVREVQASEAKTHLPSLLDEVERGETIVITRHGRPIARIVPESERRRAEIRAAIEDLKALRRSLPKIPLRDLLAARHEGHKH
jgi:prevent-host-death family protein